MSGGSPCNSGPAGPGLSSVAQPASRRASGSTAKSGAPERYGGAGAVRTGLLLLYGGHAPALSPARPAPVQQRSPRASRRFGSSDRRPFVQAMRSEQPSWGHPISRRPRGLPSTLCSLGFAAAGLLGCGPDGDILVGPRPDANVQQPRSCSLSGVV